MFAGAARAAGFHLEISISPPPPLESATSYPAPGEIIFYPGGASESELLLAYGGVSFARKAGQLARNPLLVISERLDRLTQIGREILWEGAREIVIG